MWDRNITHVDIMTHRWQRFSALMQGKFVAPEIDVHPPTYFTVAGLTAQNVDIELFCNG
jgi:hypothetical protein